MVKVMTKITTRLGRGLAAIHDQPGPMRLGLVIGSFVAYSLAIVPMYLGFGGEVGIFAVLPVAVAGWLLGLRGALLFGLLVIPFHTILLNFLGQTGWDVIIHKSGQGLHVTILVVGVVVALIRNPHLRLRRQFQEQVRIEGQLKDANEALRHEIATREGTEAALRESNARLESALDQLRALQENLLAEERMRALGRMASGVAHDLNNTLMPILGYTDLLLSQKEFQDGPPKAMQRLEAIKRAANQAAQTVRRLADFYRPADRLAEKEVVPMSQLVSDALELTRPVWESQAEAGGITIAMETDLKEDAAVNGVAPELCQAIVNLILNGVDALPEGGSLVIQSKRKGYRVELAVGDTGTGMSEVVRQRCMEPFFTTKTGTGRGLGLAIVFGTVSRHGGTIDVQSEEGHGTRVTLCLPCAEGAQVPEKPPAPALPPSPKRILVIDDDEAVLDLIVDLLRSDGHTVVVAATGQDGLGKFHPGAFDLVLVDLALPDVSGDQAAHQPVILVTGFGDIMQATGDQPAGVDLVVGKPFTRKTIREAIAQVTARAVVGQRGEQGTAPDC